LSLVASLAAFHCCFSMCIVPCYFVVKNKLMMMMGCWAGTNITLLR